MMTTMKDMMAEFTGDNGRSESGRAEYSAAVGQIPCVTVPTSTRETLAAAVGIAANYNGTRDKFGRGRLAEFVSNRTRRNCIACRGWPTKGLTRPVRESWGMGWIPWR